MKLYQSYPALPYKQLTTQQHRHLVLSTIAVVTSDMFVNRFTFSYLYRYKYKPTSFSLHQSVISDTIAVKSAFSLKLRGRACKCIPTTHHDKHNTYFVQCLYFIGRIDHTCDNAYVHTFAHTLNNIVVSVHKAKYINTIGPHSVSII